MSLMLLPRDVGILSVFDECHPLGYSSDFLLPAESYNDAVSGFWKNKSNPLELLWFEITYCFKNSFNTNSLTSPSMILLSIPLICLWIAVRLGRFLFLYFILSISNKTLGWNDLIIDSNQSSQFLFDVIDKF